MIEGKDLMVFWRVDGKDKAIAMATNCSLSMNRDSIETTSKSSGDSREYIPTVMSWSLTSENLVCEENRNLLYKLFLEGAIITVSFALSFGCEKPTEGWERQGTILEGRAFIAELTEAGPQEGLAQHSIVFQGVEKPHVSEYKTSGAFSDGFNDGFK